MLSSLNCFISSPHCVSEYSFSVTKVNTWKRRNVDFGGRFRLSGLWLADYFDCGMGARHSALSGEHSSFPQGGGKQEQGGGERGDREGSSEQKKRAEGQSSSANSTVHPENSTVSWEDRRLLPNPSTWDPQEPLDRKILSDKL